MLDIEETKAIMNTDHNQKNILDAVIKNTDNYLDSKSKVEKKEIGQFFTSKETALYMAEMFTIPDKPVLKILDPGTGTGVLSVALIEKLQKNDIEKIELTCYENDSTILPILKENLEIATRKSRINLIVNIHEENYILSQSDDFNNSIFENSNPTKYDMIIGNPPYKKINKNAEEAVCMKKVCHGAPNLYFLFTSMSIFNLAKDGQLVYIIPRSWTSGTYFKSFREYLIQDSNIEQMHLFVSRDKVFEKEKVLQETMILKLNKKDKHKENIVITSSANNSDFHNLKTLTVPYDEIVVGEQKYVFLITSKEEAKVVEKINSFEYTLPLLGLKMKTGITVDFRNRDELRNSPESNTVPLFYSSHIKNGEVVFPIEKNNQFITNEKAGVIQKNKNYLFVKRFTSKEEKRRLQSGIYLHAKFPEYEYISTQNKINFIDFKNGDTMDDILVYGLFVIFNSSIYDAYYRILNGSTQVNATEINNMPIPSINQIRKMGIELKKLNNLSEKTCDIILEELND